MLLVSKIYAAIKKIPQDFGYRHLKYKFQNDKVDVIIISKHGDERMAKPLILFCQQNLPKPIIVYDEKGVREILPFDDELFLKESHIVIVGQPCIPVILNANESDNGSIAAKGFDSRNHLDYYVHRNNFILKELLRERSAMRNKVVVIGYRNGSSIAAKMAFLNKKVTHLIYACGNPYGQIASEIVKSKTSDGSETIFNTWKAVVETSNSSPFYNSCKPIYDFSIPQRNNLMALAIPTFITYNKGDCASVFNDLLRIEAIGERRSHLTFRSFDSDKNLSKMSNDWLKWLQQNPNE